MKKLLYLIMGAAMFAACSDQNEVVDNLIDEVKNRPIVKSFPYTLASTDYNTIATAATKDAGDDAANRALATAVRDTKSLNSFADPLKYIPVALAARFPVLGIESAIRVTYAYTPEYLSRLASALPPAEVIFAEDFETGYEDIVTSFPYSKWDRKGWTNIVTVGGGQKYHRVRSRSGFGTYHEVTSNGNPAEVTEAYVISPAIDLSQTTDNNFTFDLVVGYWNYAGLSVLITEDASCLTTPATVEWRNITSSFNIPQTPTSGWGAMQTAGIYNLDTNYAGKTVYIAFKYNGDNAAPAKTTTYQIDNFMVSTGKVIVPEPGQVFINDPEQGWMVYADGITLTDEDYAWLGVPSLDATQAPNYLPALLAHKFNAPQEGTRKAVLFGNNKVEYIFTNKEWVPSLTGALITEQYVNDGEKWIFDPTISYTMVYTDHQMVVDDIRDNGIIDYKENKQDGATYIDSYGTSEYYYGFSGYSRYNNVNLRISYRDAYKQDTELHELGNDEEKLALLWDRLENKGMPRFLSLRFPDSPAITQGVTQHYNIYIQIHSPFDGTTNETELYMMRYKVLTAGEGETPATFEHVSTTLLD
jgi:hypothetical protein